MNKKGQALIEFVIIIPILILLLFSAFDFGMIIYNKIFLENKLNDTINMINNNELDSEINKFINHNTNRKVYYKIIDDNNNKIIKLYTEINILTPGLNKILSDPYKIEVERIIYENE